MFLPRLSADLVPVKVVGLAACAMVAVLSASCGAATKASGSGGAAAASVMQQAELIYEAASRFGQGPHAAAEIAFLERYEQMTPMAYWQVLVGDAPSGIGVSLTDAAGQASIRQEKPMFVTLSSVFATMDAYWQSTGADDVLPQSEAVASIASALAPQADVPGPSLGLLDVTYADQLNTADAQLQCQNETGLEGNRALATIGASPQESGVMKSLLKAAASLWYEPVLHGSGETPIPRSLDGHGGDMLTWRSAWTGGMDKLMQDPKFQSYLKQCWRKTTTATVSKTADNS